MWKNNKSIISALYVVSNIGNVYADPEKIPLVFDASSGKIVAIYNKKEYKIHDESMEFVIDWSSDYSRSNGQGTIIDNNKKLAFTGSVNHTHSILYIYEFATNKLFSFKNISLVSFSAKNGWVAIQEFPLYSSAATEEKNVDLLINGNHVGTFKKGIIETLEWKDDKIEMKFIQEPNKKSVRQLSPQESDRNSQPAIHGRE